MLLSLENSWSNFIQTREKKKVSNTLKETQLLVWDVTAGATQAVKTICWYSWLATTLRSVLRVLQLRSRTVLTAPDITLHTTGFLQLFGLLFIHLRKCFFSAGDRTQGSHMLGKCPLAAELLLQQSYFCSQSPPKKFPWMVLATPLRVTPSRPSVHFTGRVSQKSITWSAFSRNSWSQTGRTQLFCCCLKYFLYFLNGGYMCGYVHLSGGVQEVQTLQEAVNHMDLENSGVIPPTLLCFWFCIWIGSILCHSLSWKSICSLDWFQLFQLAMILLPQPPK